MKNERLTKLAMDLLVLGVSTVGVQKLLSNHELDEVERQLAYLPYRHAKRPEAFIVEAVRNKYSPPKEFYYAANEATTTGSRDAMDQDSESFVGQPDANPQRHRTPDTSCPSPADGGVAAGWSPGDDPLQNVDGSNRKT